MDLVKVLVSPLAVAMGLIGLAAWLQGIKRTKLALWVSVTGFLCLCLVTERPFAQYLVWQLEKRAPPLEARGVPEGVKHIVVLTDWDSDIPTLPYTSNIGYHSTARALEAHRIYRFCPSARIVILGSDAGCKYMGLLLELLGVKEGALVVDRGAADTWESAVRARFFVGRDRFVLVTSAIHMPRALKSFASQGLAPVAAPADFLYGFYPEFRFPWPRPLAYYVPNLESLQMVDSAAHEIFGLAWYAVRH